jgi:hypothetical protein
MSLLQTNRFYIALFILCRFLLTHSSVHNRQPTVQSTAGHRPLQFLAISLDPRLLASSSCQPAYANRHSTWPDFLGTHPRNLWWKHSLIVSFNTGYIPRISLGTASPCVDMWCGLLASSNFSTLPSPSALYHSWFNQYLTIKRYTRVYRFMA